MRRSIQRFDTSLCAEIERRLFHPVAISLSDCKYDDLGAHYCSAQQPRLTLARFKTRVFLVDDVNTALTTDHAVVPMTGHQRFKRVFDLHGTAPRGVFLLLNQMSACGAHIRMDQAKNSCMIMRLSSE